MTKIGSRPPDRKVGDAGTSKDPTRRVNAAVLKELKKPEYKGVNEAAMKADAALKCAGPNDKTAKANQTTAYRNLQHAEVEILNKFSTGKLKSDLTGAQKDLAGEFAKRIEASSKGAGTPYVLSTAGGIVPQSDKK